MGLLVLGIVLILWGIATALVAIAKPKALWERGKLQGFVGLLGNTGTMIFLLIAAAVAIGMGVYLTASSL